MTNLGPESWGPHAWKFIHIVALAYPVKPTLEDKQNYKRFYTTIGDIIPCAHCREHYKENLVKNPITDDILMSRKKLLNWTIDIHNEVNKLTGKNTYDYDTAVELITRNYECSPAPPAPSAPSASLVKDNNKPAPSNNKPAPSNNKPVIEKLENTNNIIVNKTDNIIVNKTDNIKIIEEINNEKNNDNTKYLILFILIVIIIMFLYYDTRKKTL
jgi:hypothetical protein